MPDQWTMANLRRAVGTYPLRGPVLDVGAGDFASWMRPVFVDRGLAYFALDQRAAEGIDIVGDVTDTRTWTGPPSLRRGPRWGTVVLMSVVEHAANPERVVRACRRLLRRGGHLIFAAPICWPHHDFPADYWRILPAGARLLLDGMDVLELVTEAGDDYTVQNQVFAVARKA